MPKPLLKARIERDRIQRHLDVHGRRELSAYAAHALPRRALSLMALALEDENAPLACGGKVVGDARADDAATDDQHIRCLHRAIVYATKKGREKISRPGVNEEGY